VQAIDYIMNMFNLPFSDSRHFNKTTECVIMATGV